jgi:hypothetical protein
MSCFACGEIISDDKSRRPTNGAYDDLFHCSNLQGVILGIGLSMLEQMFFEQCQEAPDGQDPKAKNNKRRRTNPKPVDDDENDTVYYFSNPGKKAKGGIGYAGDQREDVSTVSMHRCTVLNSV